jgi:hypothetical protein
MIAILARHRSFKRVCSDLTYGRGWTKVMTTPLVLPPLEVESCGAKANIYYFDWLKCLTALPRVFMTFVNPLPYNPVRSRPRLAVDKKSGSN